MCNLYSVTKGQSAIRDLFAVQHDRAGNLPPLPAIFPDQVAPVVRIGGDGECELVMARWGMPGPPQFGGAAGDEHSRCEKPPLARMVGQEEPVIVPATSFCEYADTKPRKTPIWFALSEDLPSLRSPACGRPGAACGAPRARPLRASTNSSAF